MLFVLCYIMSFLIVPKVPKVQRLYLKYNIVICMTSRSSQRSLDLFKCLEIYIVIFLKNIKWYIWGAESFQLFIKILGARDLWQLCRNIHKGIYKLRKLPKTAEFSTIYEVRKVTKCHIWDPGGPVVIIRKVMVKYPISTTTNEGNKQCITKKLHGKVKIKNNTSSMGKWGHQDHFKPVYFFFFTKIFHTRKNTDKQKQTNKTKISALKHL